MDPKRTFFNKLGINTLKFPQTKEELDTIKQALRSYKTGVSTSVKLNDTNMHDYVFTGSDLVLWAMNYFHFNKRTDAYEMCKFLQGKKIFRGFNNSRQLFRDSALSFYCFYDDDFDQYLRSLPREQLDYVYAILVGPLGVRMSYDSRPLLASQLIGWAMKRFVDIKSRSEAARFVTLLTYAKILKVDENDNHKYIIQNFNVEFTDVPMETCGICKQFTSILSFQPKLLLACGHTFHRACLSELQKREMGRCSICDFEHTTITVMTELDIILPFITKMLGSNSFRFRTQIGEFVSTFNNKYTIKNKDGNGVTLVVGSLGLSGSGSGAGAAGTAGDPRIILNQALRELSEFISKLRDGILANEMKVLEKLENGAEKCLINIKKYVLPKIYISLFSLYISVPSPSSPGYCHHHHQFTFVPPITGDVSLCYSKNFLF
eukprot:TRINITY_DN5501_c0_g2_i3.p1 TRINITY_DN5501_c0_g2~~TRINITY_DN5501_c0_g2_i3.p1  ORF type:complete len:433 (-),score=68.18 TRINITY_DN5501_c0_g2_i3:1175-2473(-)